MLITDLEIIKYRAAARHDEFEVMRYMLLRQDSIEDEALDALVDELVTPIIEAIDCTECANCCRVLDVYLTEGDAGRLADGVDVPLDEIVTRYIDNESARDVEEWGVFKQSPCAFLDGKLCSVYAYRPESCRMYPVFTPDFRWTLEDTIAGAGICPIIYNVLDQMVNKTEELSRKG